MKNNEVLSDEWYQRQQKDQKRPCKSSDLLVIQKPYLYGHGLHAD
jgi:hypothetical protein